jgi:hydrogenase nickel incorporation protein HypB
MVNLIGSPGSGKTTLLEATLPRLGLRAAVVEGDVATERDAERIRALGVQSVQINTQGGCHLEAHLVERALAQLDLEGVDLLFVENVGNLVCPAEFDLGEDCKVAVCSVPEGSDKPLKYPALFSQAGAVLLTKMDLLSAVRFDRELFWGDVGRLNPKASRFEMDSLSGEGIEAWCGRLRGLLGEKRGSTRGNLVEGR